MGGGINTLAIERDSRLVGSTTKWVYLLVRMRLALRQIQVQTRLRLLLLRPPAARLAVILLRAEAGAGTGAGGLEAASIAILVVVRRTEVRTHAGADTRQLDPHLLAAGIELVGLPVIERGIAQAQLILLAFLRIVQIVLVYGAIAIVVRIDIGQGRVVLGLDGGERRELLPVAVHLAGAAGGHLEDVHVETAHLVPAEQAMVVVHLRAVRAVRLRQVGAALAGIAGNQRLGDWEIELMVFSQVPSSLQPTCTSPASGFACAGQCSQCTSTLPTRTWPSGVEHSAPRSGTCRRHCPRPHACNRKII